MLRTNFFYKFYKQKRKNHYEIMKYNSNKEFDMQHEINRKIIEIDKTISENSKELLDAQIVKLRSTFSKTNNFIEKIGQNVYKVKVEDSIKWHQGQLKELYCRRRELQIRLEKLKGTFWINRIKRVINVIILSFFILVGLFIFLSGFMIIIYLLPLLILILLIYLISKKKY